MQTQAVKIQADLTKEEKLRVSANIWYTNLRPHAQRSMIDFAKYCLSTLDLTGANKP